MHVVECGAASLAMVLAYHGRRVGLDETREVTGVSRDGVSALTIMRAARWYGLEAQGFQIDADEMDTIPQASILHWGFAHFVVFDRIGRRGVHLIDPAAGRIRVSFEEFRREFTGVVLCFEPGEHFVREDRSRRRPWRHLLGVMRLSGSLGKLFFLTLLLLVLGLSFPMLTSLVVERIAPQNDGALLTAVAAGLVVVGLFFFATTYLRNILLAHLQVEVDSAMTLSFLRHLFSLPFSFIQGRPAGDLLMRANSNAQIRELITSTGVSAALDGILVFAYICFVLIWSPFLGAIALSLGVLQVAVFLLSAGRIHELHSQQIQKSSRAQVLTTQLLKGIETFKASGGEDAVVADYGNAYIDQVNCDIERSRVEATFGSLTTAFQVGAPLALLVAGGYEVMSGAISLGVMLGVVALARGFLQPLSSLITRATEFVKAGILLERIDDILAATPAQNIEEVSPCRALKGAIEIEQVTFRYGPVSPPVLRDVSLSIRPGEFVAIVGASGSGKSTLASVILGLHPPSSGRVLFDGVDVTTIEHGSLRRHIGIVPQTPYIFSGTVRDNITLGHPELSPRLVTQAAIMASIHRDIEALPAGYDTILSEGGSSLSGGQRQRLAIARSLAHKPAILILDEATSALDVTTEGIVQDNLANLGCTRIVIAHRLSTIRNADRIYVLDDGQLVEQGTHSELMIAHGTYARLVQETASNSRPSAQAAAGL